MPTPTLLGYLARFGSFSLQSEVLCTQGLAYLLREHEEARSALATEVQARTGVPIGKSLTWKAEALQDDKGRVDLEACAADVVMAVMAAASVSRLALPCLTAVFIVPVPIGLVRIRTSPAFAPEFRITLSG